ncbi:MAG: glycoside hydrolase family 99-like domain-containing protein [Thermodesulfobacteriota bacterium]
MDQASDNGRIRFIAFYLPQFHPTPENDRWWGKGFTEWTNVTRAMPLFAGHYQPRLPSDLGFYDLRLRETRHEQIALAREYGLDGFCYHYYWFSGKRLLHRPLDDMLADPASDMPFCLCWANENWTRRWDAADHDILVAQRHLPDDDLDFIKGLIPFFSDPRYIRVDGAPFLIVYRPQQLPDARRSAGVWRDYCNRIGIGKIHICAALTHGNRDYARFGFDSGVEFPPHNLEGCANINNRISFFQPFQGNVLEYEDIARSYLGRRYAPGNVYRAVFPSWDNTARTGSRAVVVLNGTPANYEYWLAETVRKTARDFPDKERLVFINAWNEWAEGCCLEPDVRFQRGFLEATRRVKNGTGDRQRFEDVGVPADLAGINRTLWADLLNVLRYHKDGFLGRVKLAVNRFPKIKEILVGLMRLFRSETRRD